LLSSPTQINYEIHIALGAPTKTGRHDIAEILLKVALKHQKSNQILAVAYILVYKP
jgi:hypothetical protein